MNLAETVEIATVLMPEAEILGQSTETRTYAELSADAGALAQSLREQGAGPGVTIATLQGYSIEFVTLLYATTAIGATLAPINARVKAPELAALLSQSRADHLFVEPRYEELTAAALATLDNPPLSHPAAAITEFIAAGSEPLEPAPVSDEATAILMHTSGTTGRPKPVPLSHETLTASLMRSSLPADGEARGGTLLAVPNHHIAGLSVLLTSVFSGRRVELLPEFTPARWLETVGAAPVDHAFVVPTMMQRILQEPGFDQADLSSLSTLSYGAAPMPRAVIENALKRFPQQLNFVAAYGQTETTGTVCVLSAEDHDLARRQDPDGRRRLSSVGRPVPGVEIAVLGEDGEPLTGESEGEVAVRFEDDEGWIETGDLGHLDPGGYLFLHSRRDDLIIRGGENIDPAEIEQALIGHPQVAEAAVVGVEDLEWGQIVAAYIVPRPGSQPSPEELVAHSKAELASYKAPARIEFTESLPRTALGKLKRRELAAIANGQNPESEEKS